MWKMSAKGSRLYLPVGQAMYEYQSNVLPFKGIRYMVLGTTACRWILIPHSMVAVSEATQIIQASMESVRILRGDGNQNVNG